MAAGDKGNMNRTEVITLLPRSWKMQLALRLTSASVFPGMAVEENENERVEVLTLAAETMEGAAAPRSLKWLYRVWSSTCPFTSRCTMMTIVGAFVLSLFLPNLTMALNSSLFFTIGKLEVYRVATTVFCSGSVLTVIFGLMSFNSLGPKLERSYGSTGLLALMGTLTVLTNVLFLVVCFVLFVLGEEMAYFVSSGGIWNLIISLTAIECMATPHTPRRFFILPFDIPGKYYPLFLALLFGLMRGIWRDLFCAVSVGYAYANGRLDRLKPSRSRVADWESGCLSNFIQRPGYIVNGASLGDEALIAPLNNPADHPSNQGNNGGGGGGGGFSSFFGGGGGEEGGAGGGAGGGGNGGESGFGSNNVIKKGGVGKGGKGGNFAGSGQTLGGGGGGGRQSGRSRTQQHDPETARMARLAALESRGAGGGVGGGANGRREGGAAVPLLAANDPGVLALQDMGFTEAEANEALQYTDGDVEAAATYLAT
eukprot:jgi/Undpi1/12483/HiC_scaffold_5.g02154.m1